jgi:lipid A 3-O-deacylase
MKNFLSVLFTAAVLIFASNTCKANGVSLYVENDILAKTDRDYTHGTRITYWNSYTNDIPLLYGDTQRIEWSLTQLIYTANPKSVVELQPDERPYAGFLGVGANAVSLVNESLQLREGVVIGMVGPASLAEQTQTGVHELIDDMKPKGWDNQIENEPILNYQYEVSYKIVKGNVFDIIAKDEVALGNMFTYNSVGAMFRLGYNLENNFGFNRIEPSPKVINASNYTFYTFICPEGRYVAQNIFLDGNTFVDSHSVEKEPFVGDFSYGVAFGTKDFEITYSYVYRSKEFEKQDEHNEFGAISLSYKF